MIAIDEITGFFDHSELCLEQIEMERNPRIPLHPELREYGLGLLRKNVPLSLLRSECLSWGENKWGALSGNNNFRYKLTSHDTSSLYRSISQERGIHQRTAAEDNLDKWFRLTRAQPPSPLLTESCLHYQAHEKPHSERFELILSTPEMKQAAWKYGHNRQNLMDLTFGFCSARALLAILMAIDDTGKGIPICFIIFTARESAKATHADYDTALLTQLLEKFKAGMGRNEKGEEFEIKIGNTDNDARERSALSTNWESIFLLLCIFHVWQAWRNALNRHLRQVPKGGDRQHVRKRLGTLMMKLLKDITTHTEALSLFSDELKFWTRTGKNRDSISKSQAKAALDFLKYLNGYVELEAYWISWSPAGAIEAAQRLSIPVSRIARTTNPLESFNGRIKGKYYLPYQHSGRLPRIDVWIFLLVTVVMPDFFKEIRSKQEMQNYYTKMRTLKRQVNVDISDTSTDAETFASISSSSIPTDLDTEILTNHDAMIQKWLDELEHDEDLDDKSFSELEFDDANSALPQCKR
jgi:hypothetical protein